MVLPGYDWAILQLGKTGLNISFSVNDIDGSSCVGVDGIINLLEIDTNFYKGNFPESCKVCKTAAIDFVIFVISYHFLGRSLSDSKK